MFPRKTRYPIGHVVESKQPGQVRSTESVSGGDTTGCRERGIIPQELDLFFRRIRKIPSHSTLI